MCRILCRNLCRITSTQNSTQILCRIISTLNTTQISTQILCSILCRICVTTAVKITGYYELPVWLVEDLEPSHTPALEFCSFLEEFVHKRCNKDAVEVGIVSKNERNVRILTVDTNFMIKPVELSGQ